MHVDDEEAPRSEEKDPAIQFTQTVGTDADAIDDHVPALQGEHALTS